MAISLRLDLKQTQSLVLTPQLQQAIKLLQLSNQEILGTLQREVMENPFLALTETSGDQRPAAPAAADGLSGAPTMKGSSDAARPDAPEPGEWDAPRAASAADHRLGLRQSGGGRTSSSDEDDGWRTDSLSRKPDLRDHLRRQIAVRLAGRPVRELAILLVDWIDDDGYLRDSDAELADALRAEAADIAAARRLIQGCEPTGVGARDLAECLSLQLAERDRLDPAMARLLQRLPALAQADWSTLERHCKVDREDLEQMVGEIKALDPRPGLRLQGDEPDGIVPDLIVFRAPSGRWRVELNQGVLPRVIVDGDYYAEIAQGGLDAKAREFVAERYQAASWLVKALQQRSRTIIRVAKALFERQRGFLDNGPRGLRPLVLRDIAAATGLHESTVSRATTEKYVQTPYGTFSLKYFFTTAIQSSCGGEGHSAEAIRQQIRKLVQKETASAVLSDDQIVDMLRGDGVAIARRTVAKYRESLGIPSSVQRRRSKALVG